MLLSAGLGTRLRPITNTTPKCLVPICGKPLLDYWLDLLLQQGVERVLINTHYLSDQVDQHLAASPWKDRIDMVHEKDLLGTGGSIMKNESFFMGKSFIVAHADNLTKFDVQAFIERHETRPDGVHITMMTFTTESPESCGIVEEDENGIVIGFHEKKKEPPGNHANGAVYVFDQSVLDFMRGLGKPVIDISTEVIPSFLGKINTYHNDVYLRDIGTVGMLRKAERDLGGVPSI